MSKKHSSACQITHASPQATGAYFQIVTLPGARLLIADSTHEPQKRRGTTTLSEVPEGLDFALKDEEISDMRYASDLWHYQWVYTREPRGGPGSLTYIMEPVADEATSDVLKWIAKRENLGAIDDFPGHTFATHGEVGTVLLGTSLARDAVRLLVQHKAEYGDEREIAAIRFWKTQVAGGEPIFSTLITLTGSGGYKPLLLHDSDESRKSKGSGSLSPLPSKIGRESKSSR